MVVTTWTLRSGAVTAGTAIDLPSKPGSKLVHVGVTCDTSTGPWPVSVYTRDSIGGLLVPLPGMSGWVRNDSFANNGDWLSWSGEQPLDTITERPQLVVFIRNDTGQAGAVTIAWRVDSG